MTTTPGQEPLEDEVKRLRDAERLAELRAALQNQREADARGEYEAEPPHPGLGAIIVGLIFIALGVVITLFTYAQASDAGGGTYVVAYGPIIFGVIKLIQGFAAR